MKMYLLVTFLILFFGFSSCDLQENGGSYTYVKSSVDKNGRARKGYYRKSVSTSKSAVKNQNRSRYYYHTRKKQRSK
jgi:hypothetical protein